MEHHHGMPKVNSDWRAVKNIANLEKDKGPHTSYDLLVFPVREKGCLGLMDTVFVDGETRVWPGTYVLTKGVRNRLGSVGVVHRILPPSTVPPRPMPRILIRWCHRQGELYDDLQEALRLSPRQLVLTDEITEEPLEVVDRVINAEAYYLSNPAGEDFFSVVSPYGCYI